MYHHMTFPFISDLVPKTDLLTKFQINVLSSYEVMANKWKVASAPSSGQTSNDHMQWPRKASVANFSSIAQGVQELSYIHTFFNQILSIASSAQKAPK